MPLEPISDFFCLNEEKAALLLKFGSQFVECSQANLLSTLFSSNLYPILPESLTEFPSFSRTSKQLPGLPRPPEKL